MANRWYCDAAVIARTPAVAVAVAALAACTGAPLPTPAVPGPSSAAVPIASSAGSSVAWPAVTVVPAPALHTPTRPMPHDLAQLRTLRGATISRDGARIAYVVRAPTFDPAAKPSPDDPKAGWKVEQQLFLVDRAGGASRQLTYGDEPVTAARFSPDGHSLAFVRKKAGKPALHVLALGGGEPRVVALGDYEPQTFDWAPDGKAFVFTAIRPPTDEQKAERWRRGGARAYDREWEQVHLLVVPVAGGEPRKVNRGTDTVMSYVWSPDGKRIALVVAPSTEPVEAGAFHKLIVVSAGDGGDAQALDQGDGKTPFIIRQVAWSPDSRQLAYAVTARGGLSHIDELRVRAADGGRVTDVAAKLDLELTGFAWAGDARSLVASATVRTVTRLYRLALDGRGAKEIAIGKRVLTGLEGDRAGRYLVAVASTPTTPAEPTVIDVERGTVAPVATINPQLADWTIARNEIVTWKNSEGVALDGVLTVTGHATPGTPPPLIVIPHGGPDSASQEGFNGWAQFFAARGYSVFEPNYRGGTGYGRPFYEANRGRFGAIELADIESGVDALIGAGKADRTRLFYAGWSWGGYLSAWTLGHTDRYRAFMVGAGIVDVVVQYVTSDINHGVAADWEFKGRPWLVPEAFERPNPSRALASARAPTLIFHGESDERVPFVNGQILYRALRDAGTPVTFWAYPREPHGFQEPAHVEHLMTTWAAFFDAQLAVK